MIIIVMGVSGSGKSTIGRLLAAELGWNFYEGDDLHPAANIEKMRKGEPLTDQDRAPWLASLSRLVDRLERESRSAVMACSLLKEKYRAAVAAGRETVRFVYLRGETALISSRIERRRDHFMASDLLESQLEILEEPDPAVVADIRQGPAEIVGQIKRALHL